MSYRIPFHAYRLSLEEEKAVGETLNSGWLTSGSQVSSFENEFSEYIGPGFYSAAVSSCTSALFLTLYALELPKHSAVLVPSFNYVSDVLAIIHNNLRPVLVDISPEDYNFDYNEIINKATSDVRAVVVVHYAGNPCRMDEIIKLCMDKDLVLIEDCAHAIESRYYGVKAGTFGFASVFSFYPNKNITSAEGGMIISKDFDFIQKCKRLRNHGIEIDAYAQHKEFALRNFDISIPGFKMNMSDIHAALGRVQLKSIEPMHQRRLNIFNMYDQLLNKSNIRIVVKKDENILNAHHFLPIEVDESVRNNLATNLIKNGVQPSMHYKPVHKFTFARNCEWSNVDLPNTELAYKRQLSLPVYPNMTESDVEFVCKVVNQSV
ncbi:MAG: DegT/DnrJ/EryC1/StrS aminotransferase family protein [Bacteroidia bacterium]|nr:DegT/DnrJ/EryC1/StrS aminotransferase family protein [Bacteroidia bacterium]